MPPDHDPERCNPEDYIKPPSKTQKDLEVQLLLTLILGVSALIAFCILRPRWPSLYSARKRRLDRNVGLPELPNSFFGWMPRLYRVTEEQILASAGLDAFVFLAFFKMAIRLFATMSFTAVVVLWPINYHYRHFQVVLNDSQTSGDDEPDRSREKTFLWAYVVFTYFFVALTLYSVNWETVRIVRFRQDYLGSQSTVTDRTFRLTGIPMRLRSGDKLKNLIERLDIGLVDSVTLCRDWKELDEVVEHRDQTLRKLEAAWAKHLKLQEQAVTKQHGDATQTSNDDSSSGEAGSYRDDEESGENTRLLVNGSNRPPFLEGDRPEVRIRYGPLKLRTRKVDAIDYYEEKLRRLDERVMDARGKEYEAADMALVTMDSVASCQMVIQARIDPRPGRLLTKSAPSPSDLVWRNTYALRGVRRFKSWAITLFITFLTLIWIFPTAILASWLSICTIKRVMPSFYTWLSDHPIILSLLQNGAPTLVVSLLNVAVPYLYDFLSNRQGMISQGDVELSLISKNFFFTFFNTFFVFAVSRTGFDFWSVLRGFLKDTSKIPAVIASDVEELSIFYIGFIMLQGIGLMPFRVLEVGSVFLYPIYRMTSSTPRDFARLQKPPVFQYGFYLPTALLVFNLCLIYSVLKWGFVILIFGTVYFALGYFTFKYMVLYAMDQPQHATGGAWRIICYRIVIGLLVFEVVMVGQIASLAAFVQSVTILPLIPFTIWYSFYFTRRFEPLTKYIALRAIKSRADADSEEAVDDASDDEDEPRQSQALLRRGSTLDEFKERGLVFVNPSLVVPLQQPWIYHDPPPPLSAGDTETDGDQSSQGQPALILPNADSTLGIGDDNVWINGAGRDD
ncbi:Calcium permeable stress-gated cation channel 1 [Tolypocladium capitatum]|uniref:Calcium permeable stress-gated cation channel 1 n=1 Tax=Tolypocladium capitatum TaxID=45235 RepID=A0A2K3Q6W1_9HYPO|nr:Calcium permeable stress-gated cation channel 1 [Tolypocladium capitatum]